MLDVISKRFLLTVVKILATILSPLSNNKFEMDTIGTGFKEVGGKLLVRLSKVPNELNKSIFSEGQEIGRLLDIIGPTAQPVGIVSISKKGDYIGKAIFIQ